ncbi:hypothetical protein [Streptomyces sp. NBC_00483]|uniref:hypothetical protein n=1 Tax=Streptomyces sp. NBC_00483 TaxID=2975756 RepID=UPI002E1932B7
MTRKTPPEAGKRLSVAVDQALYDDLVTLMSTGMTLTDAVKHAASLVAHSYRYVWDHGSYPRDVLPRITGYLVERHMDHDAPPPPNLGPVDIVRDARGAGSGAA